MHGVDLMSSSIRKRSVRLFGHLTSISLEAAFWQELQRSAAARGITMTKLIEAGDADRTGPDDDMLASRGNLSSALRLYVLADLTAQRDAAVPLKDTANDG